MTAAEPDISALGARLSSQAVVRPNEPLSRHTTLRVGGPADLYVQPASEKDLREVLLYCRESDIPWMMLGRGSNLLVRDGGIRGTVISLGASFSEIEIFGERLRCGAAARLRSAAYEARKHSLGGLEFMEGIPGNIGGALRMNAGAMGSSIFEWVESVRVMSPEGDISERPAGEIQVEYRHCPLFKTHIALSAVLRPRASDRETIESRMDECSRKRWASQPAAPSAGCIFKNAAGIATGRLVQELGLKGRRAGGAVISDVHGNFIINEGQASARDVLELIELVRESARRERGLELETEVQIVGED
jgi:UDP-N-acetylenolpyruvoylglucosamine reductase